MAFDASASGALFSRELQLALSGDLVKTIDAHNRAIQSAAQVAMEDVVNDAKAHLRGVVTAAGLGRRLANAVRGKVYENRGEAPAGFLYVDPGAVKIFTAFGQGATIKPKDGRFLYIPIPGSPADRKNFGQQRSGQSIVESIRARGIEMSFVPGNGSRPAMLVAKSVRISTGKTGREKVSTAKLTKSGAFAKGAASVPLFWLVPQAVIPQRFDWNGEVRRIADGFLKVFAQYFEEYLQRYLSPNAIGFGRGGAA